MYSLNCYNLGLLTLTSGLLRLESGRAGTAFLILVFAAAAATSIFGAKIVRKGHEYYKRAAVKKTSIENRLGLLKRLDTDAHGDSTLAIGTTPGMANIDRIRRAPDEWIAAGPSRGSIVFYAISVDKARTIEAADLPARGIDGDVAPVQR